LVGSEILVAVIIGWSDVEFGTWYVAEVEDVEVKLPRQAGNSTHPVLALHETPRFDGSLLTEAVKVWVPPSTTVADMGETVTLIGGSAGVAPCITVTLPLMTFAT
jgi:hypothetical protein